jgi:hypothetical protein
MPFVFVATVAETPHSYKAHSSNLKRSVYVAQYRKPPEWPERSFTYNIFPYQQEYLHLIQPVNLWKSTQTLHIVY